MNGWLNKSLAASSAENYCNWITDEPQLMRQRDITSLSHSLLYYYHNTIQYLPPHPHIHTWYIHMTCSTCLYLVLFSNLKTICIAVPHSRLFQHHIMQTTYVQHVFVDVIQVHKLKSRACQPLFEFNCFNLFNVCSWVRFKFGNNTIRFWIYFVICFVIFEFVTSTNLMSNPIYLLCSFTMTWKYSQVTTLLYYTGPTRTNSNKTIDLTISNR